MTRERAGCCCLGADWDMDDKVTCECWDRAKYGVERREL